MNKNQYKSKHVYFFSFLLHFKKFLNPYLKKGLGDYNSTLSWSERFIDPLKWSHISSGRPWYYSDGHAWTQWTTSFGHTSRTSPTWPHTTPKAAWSPSSAEYSPSSRRRLWKRHALSSGSVSRVIEARLYHHHHHIALVARISLTLSRHSSLSFIALGRSSGQHTVSSHSCWMYVRAGRPAFARPCVGIHNSTSLMSSSLLLQQCPACLVRLTWIVFVIGGRWPYSWCLVGCCCQDLFRIARSILV